MSDKNKYNKDFADRGWKNMSSILDREMPVKQKKRRILYFLLLFLGIISCGTIIRLGLDAADLTTAASGITEQTLLDKMEGNSGNNNAPILNSDPTETEIKINGENNPKKINNDNATQTYDSDYGIGKLENNSPTGHLFLNEKKTTAVGIKIPDSKIWSRQPAFIPNNNNNNNGVSENKEIGRILGIRLSDRKILNQKPEPIPDMINMGNPTNGRPGGNVKIKAADLEILNNESELIPGIIDKKNPTKENVKHRDEIKILEPVAVSGTDYFESPKRKSLPFNPRIRTWKFGLEAGFVFQNKNEQGGRIAWIATKKMTAQWLFHTGLEYNVQFVNYTTEEQGSVTMDGQEDLGGIGSGVNSEQENIEILQSSPMHINSHFIRIPLLFGYKPNRSFELTGGILGSMMIYSGAGVNRGDYMPSASAWNYDNDIHAKKIVPTFDIQASMGMTYYPNKKWGINIRYDNGFLKRKIKFRRNTSSKAAIDLEKYNSRNRLWSLSARMYF